MKKFIRKKINIRHGLKIIWTLSIILAGAILFTNIRAILGSGTGDADSVNGMHWTGCTGTDCNIKDYIDSKSSPCTDNNTGNCYIAQALKSTLDSDLNASNIKSGVTIFGVSGIATCTVLKSNGQTCSSGNECQSGFCVDGYCCNSACSSTCQSCNVTNSLGTCTNDLINSQPAECNGNSYCNGSGVCKTCNWVDGCSNACQASYGFCCNNDFSAGTCKPGTAGEARAASSAGSSSCTSALGCWCVTSCPNGGSQWTLTKTCVCN